MGLFSSAKNLVNKASPFNAITGNKDLTSMIPGIGDSMAQEDANKANVKEAALNRAFQERMSNTAYSRAMTDMKSAGLNPILAYMQGGASAPSGGTATIESAPKTALANTALSAVTGIGGLQQKATALQQQQSMNESTIQLQQSSAAKQIAETQKTQVETQKAKKDLPAAKLQGELAEKGSKIVDKIMSTMENSAKSSSMWKLDSWKKAFRKPPKPVKAKTGYDKYNTGSF